MPFPRKRGAILFTDIQDFTRRMNEGEALGMRLMKEHNEIMDAASRDHEGTVVKSIGDSYLVVFEEALSAAKCALAAQSGFAVINREKPESERLNVRMSLHVGEVMIKDQDIFGNEVNLAARILGITPAGRIYASKAIFDELDGKLPQGFIHIGAKQFKGFSQASELYELPHDSWTAPASHSVSSGDWHIHDSAPEPTFSPKAGRPTRSMRKTPVIAAVTAVACVAGAIVLVSQRFDWAHLRWRSGRRFEQLHLGMAPGEVSSLIGAPELETSQAGMDLWFYGPQALRSEPGEYGGIQTTLKAEATVLFREGRMTEIDESGREWVVTTSAQEAPKAEP